MNAWPSHLQAHWYAVALSREVRCAPVARTLLDRPLVLARLEEGVIAAFEDRCPHRQAPLSAGRIVDGRLQCPYHGWRFDRAGHLCAIPGLREGEAPPAVSARRLAAQEHDGIVWVRPQADAGGALPAIATAQPSEHRRFLWSTRWDAHVMDAMENVLDGTHTHYVHSGLVRDPASRKRVIARLSPYAGGFEVDYSGTPAQSGLIYRLFESEREREVARFSVAASVQFEYAYRNGANARISLHFAPESAASTRLHVAFHIHGRWAPAWAVRAFVWPFLRRVAMQDARMLHLQSQNRVRFSGRRDVIGPLDIVRPWLEAWYRDGEAMPMESKVFEFDL